MLGLYVHIPFCSRRCRYCDFVSYTDTGRIAAYVEALEKEIGVAGRLNSQKVDTVFIGGGTPGILPDGGVSGILDCLRRSFNITADAEITIETNPGAVHYAKLREYLNNGVNRLSLGVQAVQARLLELLGRRHTCEVADRAFNLARDAGFTNINLDLIYAIPTQTMDDWDESLGYVLGKRPEHVSAYALKIENGTEMARMTAAGELAAADDELDAEMYLRARERLTGQGYAHYEISNFALAGRECRHNLRYWNLRDYLGLGVSAHSNVGAMRFFNTSDLDKYIAQMKKGGVQYEKTEMIGGAEREFEYVMLKLRLAEGISFREYKRLFDKDFMDRYEERVRIAVEKGLAAVDGDRLKPTEKGFLLQNQLIHILTEQP
jgi:oxygen-independent coproporphyrinogen-3 oxidase